MSKCFINQAKDIINQDINSPLDRINRYKKESVRDQLVFEAWDVLTVVEKRSLIASQLQDVLSDGDSVLDYCDADKAVQHAMLDVLLNPSVYTASRLQRLIEQEYIDDNGALTKRGLRLRDEFNELFINWIGTVKLDKAQHDYIDTYKDNVASNDLNQSFKQTA